MNLKEILKPLSRFVSELGMVGYLFFQCALLAFQRPLKIDYIVRQMEFVGVKSLPVVFLTGTFTGMVLALQSYYGFRKVGAEGLIGVTVALSMTRELGPVLTGLMVASRAGSAMAAEIGTMRVTEQIDALVVMALNPVKYLIVPRVIASFLMLPILTIIADVLGILGGYFVAVKLLDVGEGIFLNRMYRYLEFHDIYVGLVKAACFGIIFSLICCCKGFYAKGGAEGVGKATTEAVVASCVSILVSDYILTSLLF